MAVDTASQKANIRIAPDRPKFIPEHADLAHGPCRLSSAVRVKVYSALGVEWANSHPSAYQSIAIGAFPAHDAAGDEQPGTEMGMTRRRPAMARNAICRSLGIERWPRG